MVTFGQIKKDTIIVAKDSVKELQQEDLLTDKDIALIDSLVIEAKFNSALMDDIIQYYIPNTDTINVSEVQLDS